MENESPVDPEELEALLLMMSNPFYALTISPVFSETHKPLISEEDFIKVGVRLINDPDVGAEKYLTCLLENLKGNYVPNEETPEKIKDVFGYKFIEEK